MKESADKTSFSPFKMPTTFVCIGSTIGCRAYWIQPSSDSSKDIEAGAQMIYNEGLKRGLFGDRGIVLFFHSGAAPPRLILCIKRGHYLLTSWMVGMGSVKKEGKGMWNACVKPPHTGDHGWTLKDGAIEFFECPVTESPPELGSPEVLLSIQ